jgi:hypothetical protein
MMNLYVLLGKNIHKLVTQPGSTIATASPVTYLYPEIWRPPHGLADVIPVPCVLHPDDYVYSTLDMICADMHGEYAIVLITQSPFMVSALSEYIGKLKIIHNQVHVHLYAEDNLSFDKVTFDETGVLHNWPFGWFELGL